MVSGCGCTNTAGPLKPQHGDLSSRESVKEVSVGAVLSKRGSRELHPLPTLTVCPWHMGIRKNTEKIVMPQGKEVSLCRLKVE